MIEKFTLTVLQKLMPHDLAELWVKPLTDTMIKYDINTDKRIACWLGQVLFESNNLKTLEENLNYSAEGLEKTFPRYFDGIGAHSYAHKPEEIANIVYTGRLGNVQQGDGWKYRGRGPIQITGRRNYNNLSNDLNYDFVKDPEALATNPHLSALSAGWFWDMNKLNPLADVTDVLRITRKVNGGTHGLEERVAKTKLVLSLLNDSEQIDNIEGIV